MEVMQRREAVTIQHAQGEGLLNRQDEWRQVKLPHINLSLSQCAPPQFSIVSSYPQIHFSGKMIMTDRFYSIRAMMHT